VAATLDEVYAPDGSMVGRRVANEYVLVPVGRRGAADLDSLYNLTDAGAFIWEQLDGRASGAEIVARLVGAFEVSTEDAERDYLEFIEELARLGAVRRTDRRDTI
jgi:hypothetical protein